jgi:hypothetical protein
MAFAEVSVPYNANVLNVMVIPYTLKKVGLKDKIPLGIKFL